MGARGKGKEGRLFWYMAERPPIKVHGQGNPTINLVKREKREIGLPRNRERSN